MQSRAPMGQELERDDLHRRTTWRLVEGVYLGNFVACASKFKIAFAFRASVSCEPI